MVLAYVMKVSEQCLQAKSYIVLVIAVSHALLYHGALCVFNYIPKFHAKR